MSGVQDLSEENLGLVRSEARRLKNRLPAHVSLDDLVSSGTLGLVEAARRFDPLRQVSFRSYAARRVRGAMVDFLRTQTPGTRSLRTRLRKLQAEQEALAHQLGRQPTAQDLKQFGIYQEAQRAGVELVRSTVVSLDTPLDPERPDTLGERLASETADPEQEILQWDLKQSLMAAMAALSPRERRLLWLRYFESWSFHQIGESFGVTSTRAFQLHSRSLDKLRQDLNRRQAA